MFKKIKEKIQQKVTLWVFRLIWKEYNHAFKQSNDVLSTLPEEKKTKYLLDVKRWVESGAFEGETQRYIKMFMSKLSFSAVTETEMTAIRMTLLFLKEQEERLLSIARNYNSQENQKIMVESSKIINRI